MLIGLAASFALPDLHLADILNERLGQEAHCDVRVDVFDVEDADSWEHLNRYFPIQNLPYVGWHGHPIVGIWENGQFQEVLIGHAAMSYVLQRLAIPMTPAEVIDRMRPPDRKWFDERASTIDVPSGEE